MFGIDHAISTIWALDGDFTEARGTTVRVLFLALDVELSTLQLHLHLADSCWVLQRVVPGSHLWPTSRTALASESVPAEMARGSALLYTGRTHHGAGHNQTAAPRHALNVAYNSRMLKQEENMYVATPPRIACALPKQLQSLIGYSIDQQPESRL